LALLTHDKALLQALAEHKDIIAVETLADDLVLAAEPYAYTTECTVDGAALAVGLEKA
jgi:hypothetical protein